ncbi:MAG: methionine adenosyltransferase [Bacteroidia bacterium]|nr:methionine adenosyltransferase [Bacteroidia bacterium]MDW8302519.1 methionine adenosyltransferase [Bacteroidia bacterium]
MPYLFTSESVSEGHPDKIADQISDAILDAHLAQDKKARVACETLVTTGLVVLAGEITSKAQFDVQEVVRRVIEKIGYKKSEYKFDAQSCAVISAIHQQSPDIAVGVNETENKEQGAGDQGIMFGYANDETPDYMPMPIYYAHKLVEKLAQIRKEGKVMTYLRPDAKSQVTIEYSDNHKALRIDTIVVSTQHDPGVSQSQIHKDIKEILIPAVIPTHLLDEKTKYFVNPTGIFEIGGPHGDSGLTGRKIIVDTYGGKGAHGGGAFSGKDPSKVDRSAAYAVRHIAKNIVAAGLAKECLVQVAYAIGVAQPVSIFVNTYGTGKVPDSELADYIVQNISLKPADIIKRFDLCRPIYENIAAYGHMGRTHVTTLYYRKPDGTYDVDRDEKGNPTGKLFTVEIPWEKLDLVETLKAAFSVRGYV